MRKKGFTLVELLIVIAIIALLMGILMPALARVRMYAYRMTCGTNLSGIGKAIMLYSNDSRGEAYPMPGCTNMAGYAYSTNDNGFLRGWYGGNIGVPNQGTPAIVYNSTLNGGAGHATIGSLFYLLVKYQDVSVKQFNCKGDIGVKVFKLTDFTQNVITEFSKAWDFGAAPGRYCSYSYHNPLSSTQDGTPTNRASGFPVGGSSPPSSPLAADRNPTLDKNVSWLNRDNTDLGGQPEPLPEAGKKSPKHYWDDAGGASKGDITFQDPDLIWNSFAHQREGQNVLYNDGHVNFERTCNVGIDGDNIWQSWPSVPPGGTGGSGFAKYDREVGGYFAKGGTAALSYTTPIWGTNPGTWFPRATEDSLLISDQQDCVGPP